MSDTVIYLKDLPLYVDVYCYACKRLCALSDTIEQKGRHYCGSCAGLYRRGAAIAEFLTDWPDAAVIRID